jgi:hypothetical protein
MCHHRPVIDHLSLAWRKSSYCGNSSCVEVANDGGEGGTHLMRDSKLAVSPVLAFGADRWREFLDGVRAGDFDRR